MQKADLTQRVINPEDSDYPWDLRCRSGHVADAHMERDGRQQLMRFIHVSGEAIDPRYQGIYCEKCLVLANKMAKSKRKY